MCDWASAVRLYYVLANSMPILSNYMSSPQITVKMEEEECFFQVSSELEQKIFSRTVRMHMRIYAVNTISRRMQRICGRAHQVEEARPATFACCAGMHVHAHGP